MADEPEILIAGDLVALGPLRKDLAHLQARWINTPEVRVGLSVHGILTQETEEQWLDDAIKAGAGEQPTQAGFVIYDRSDMAPVGAAHLFRISYLSRLAALGIWLGERRGRGLGSEATHLVLDWAFNVLGLRNVMLEALASNTAALRAYEKAGFRRIGVRRGAGVAHGKPADEVLMDAVPEDFTGSRLV